MKTIIIVLAVVIIALLSIIFNLSKQIKDLKAGKGVSSEDNLQELEMAIGKLMAVRDKLEIVDKLRYGYRCKEELLKLVKDLFFYGQLKEPEERATYFARKAESYRDRTWDEAENLELAKMYDELASYAKHHINHLEQK